MRDFLSTVFKQEEYTVEVQGFNVVQAIYFFGLLFMSGVIFVCIPDNFYVYVTVIMCLLLIVSMIDVNRTGNVKVSACINSIVTNFIYLPLCFYGFGKLICCVPVYFILGILYSAYLIGGKTGAIVSIIETIYMSFILVFIGRKLPNFYTNPPTYIDFFAIAIAVLIVSVLAAIAIKAKVTQYEKEFDRMQGAHLKVIDAYNSKDIFFANTSHEIRTPLNAIIGTVNLLLDEELDVQARENVYNILNSCNALLSITDELMELSNTENGNVSIAADRYDFSEMISDIINMMEVRLMESAVTLYVELDTNIPKFMIGDGGKVRQLFINILNNAVKYTKEGKIILRVRCHRLDEYKIDLQVEVEDTGIGIKEEAIPKLFSDYNRDEEDAEKRSIEGTGLGLSLCRDLVSMMNGNISVESEYHVGSTFKFNIIQETKEDSGIAIINTADYTDSIIFENNSDLAENLKKVLDDLQIKSVIVSDRMEFETSVLSGRFGYVFIAAERYMENQRFIDRKLRNQRMVVISDISQSVQLNRNCYILARPCHIINVAMAFNNEVSSFGREIIQKGGFTCPDTNILVVDDNFTNLEVASGLLKKYEATIVTAVSGAECINAIERMHFDLIFLDYMMPEMNGIDTLYALRGLDSENAKNVPVVALTANVISGAREMFMDAGFSDYISKPIDVDKLEKTLKTFIPREQLRIKL